MGECIRFVYGIDIVWLFVNKIKRQALGPPFSFSTILMIISKTSVHDI